MKTDIVAIGELLIDFTVEDAERRLFSANPGGAPANFAAAAAAAGAETAMIAKVGADAFGDMLIREISQAGVNTAGIVADPSVFTTLAFVTVDEAGERSFSFARKPGADTMLREDELPQALLKDCRALHFGSLSFTDEPACSAVLAAVRIAKESGALISCDPNYRPPLWKSEAAAVEAMRCGLALADVVKISGEEAALVTGKTDPAAAADTLLREFGCGLVFVTLGAKGCYYANEKAAGYVPAFAEAKTVDTTGAGDIFGGTALALLLRQPFNPAELNADTLNGICRFACTVAGLSTERRGGISSVPDRDTVEKIICKSYGKIL